MAVGPIGRVNSTIQRENRAATPEVSSALPTPNEAAIAIKTGQSTDFLASPGEMQPVAIMAPAARNAAKGNVDLAAHEARDHDGKDDGGNSGSAMTDGAGILDVTHQVEIRVIAIDPAEVGPYLEEERISRVEHDVADLIGEPRAIPMDGDDRRVVDRPEVDLAHRFAQKRRAGADDRLAELPASLRIGSHLIAGVRRWDQSGDLLEVDDRSDDAGEDQAVVGLDPLVGADRAARKTFTINIDQEQAREVS